MFTLYRRWGALGYWAKRFYQTFSRHCKRYKGGVAAVRSVLAKRQTAGLMFLRRAGRLDLSVERLVLHSTYRHLFGDVDRELARAKLDKLVTADTPGPNLNAFSAASPPHGTR